MTRACAFAGLAAGLLLPILMERFVRPQTGGSGSGFGLQFSRDPDQNLLYLVDGTNERVWMLRRKDSAVLDHFGRPRTPGRRVHPRAMLAIDSKSRMYIGEAGNGRRIQRCVLKGKRPASAVTPPVQQH